MVDFAAQQIANLIRSQPDWNEREYGAVVYQVGNEIRVGPLTRGQTVQEAIDAGLDAPRTNIQLPADLGNGVILAVVHSHPNVGYEDVQDVENRYPSDHDYDEFDARVSSGSLASDPRFANNVAFAQYVLGSDGILREFNKKDGRLTLSNDMTPDSRDDLYLDRPCH